ncbi:hypothetical protein TRL7639_03310 [Falsiruegeria litorea R37]|uniref:DUF1330 domain-containing protein n=1 Tax=Falsiruegeria litorea R37 TaxID=1200284 RepID=A0A1Y5TGV9_9RHOB|nr:DUF1330 domain-containing protein [Falsiruegeria litorea]SLN60124.1 hypothetical protein TRL7639_03310 [Falsiruegeria litorea R37]
MIYAVFKAKLNNPQALAEYREQAGTALAKHRGKVEHATPVAQALDGAPSVPDVAALLSFPSIQAAQSWINDPELADLHALRRSAGETEILLLT